MAGLSGQVGSPQRCGPAQTYLKKRPVDGPVNRRKLDHVD